VLTLTNFIANRATGAISGRTLDVLEPATGAIHATAPDSGPEEINDAVRVAKAAFPVWAATPVSERARLLHELANLIEKNLEAFAAAESADTGKPLSLASTVDIPRSAANLRYFANAVQHGQSELHDFDGGGVPGGVPAMNLTLRRPRGVAGCISPWNLPLYLLTWKIAPALATGNTVVAKPSEVTPVSAWMLGKLAREAGLPAGVLNIVHGSGTRAGAALVEHPDVPTITFTGSTSVGRWIGERCGAMLKRVSLELGGKNPFIIFADADLDHAIDTAARAAFTNQGQICLCGSRLIIEASVFNRVRDGIIARAKALRVGDPRDAHTQFGSLTSPAHCAKVEAMVDEARSLGATIHCGGARVDPASLPSRCTNGSFYAPTVLSGLDPACRVEREEIFGPVVSLQPFRDEHEALTLANSTNYGLAASIFTSDLGTAQRVSEALDAGIVWINCWMVRDLRTPFGGMKQSGVGREGGLDALRFFTEPKNVCIARALPPPNRTGDAL
jgi:aminomuconate-semialdehyde/2-hydroxymuconate-6-semialdehyde dehydrogenase